MSIDWLKLEECLLGLTIDEIRRFANVHRSEKFYGFAFDCSADNGQVILCVNSKEDLRKQAESYKATRPDLYGEETLEQLEDELRWNMGDWSYQGFQSGRFDAGWGPFCHSVLYDPDDDSNDSAVQDRFMRAMCLVLIRLESQGIFDVLNRTLDFKTFVADHDETLDESWRRLSMIRNELAGS